MVEPALLALEDGSVFSGTAAGAAGEAAGEVVFNTAMTGYQEILTDPSYARQIVTLTCAHVGNTGANEEDDESRRVWVSGLVVRDMPDFPGNWRSRRPLARHLEERGVVAVAGVDTRRLTRLLRDRGPLNGAVVAGKGADRERALELARAFPGLEGMDLAREVTVDAPRRWSEGVWNLRDGYGAPAPERFHVAVFDFGVKRAILRMLAARGCRLTVLPARSAAEEALALEPDGVLLSNGPGDPAPCGYAIDAIRRLLEERIPLFGICLGFQLLALACGARTVKMLLGHHGANHPVQDLDSGKVLITSQNHGFAVDADTLPDTLRATHRSLFDGSLQGAERVDAPAFGFQGHPEASPGPRDIAPLFDRFVRMMERARA